MSSHSQSNRPYRAKVAACLRVLFGAAAVCAMLGGHASALGQCTQWAYLSNGPGPLTSNAVRLAYDVSRERTFAVANDFNAPSELHVWQWDGEWSRLFPTTPSPDVLAAYSAWIYDSARHVCLLFGAGGNDLYEWNGTGWSRRARTGAWPPMCWKAFGGFDASRSRAVFVMGAQNSQTWQTWEWTGSVWERGPDLPGSIYPDAMTFDTWRNRGLVYGAAVGQIFEQTLEYVPGATAGLGAWHLIALGNPPTVGSVGTNLVFDSLRGRTMRINGHYQTSLYGFQYPIEYFGGSVDAWTFTSGDPANLPELSARESAGGAFDSARDKFVMFGGVRRDAPPNGPGYLTYFRDTWALSRQSPGFRSLPSSVTVDGGQGAFFAATVIGEGNTLQWLREGAPVAGANGPVLLVNNASQSVAGLYVLRVANACGVIDSAPARLTVRVPVNDSHLTPTAIYSASITGTTLGATPDGTTTCGISNSSPDVWFRYTVPYTGALTIDTCGSDYDTVLSFHSLSLGLVIGCSDDDPPAGCGARISSLSEPVNQGDTFLVRVSGYQGTAGNYSLNTRVVPFNNPCTNATEVFAGTYVGSTVGASVDGIAFCGTSSTTPDIWYRFRSGCSGTLSLDTQGSSYDTVLSVRVGGCGGAEAGCNDDVQPGTLLWSSLSVTIQPNTDYFIRVSGYNGAIGSVVLHVSPPPIPGDTCQDAVAIGLGQRTFSNRCATSSPLALPPSCVLAPGGVPFYDVWFRYVAGAPGTVEIRVCDTSFQPVLAVYGALCPTSPYDAITCSAGEDLCAIHPLASVPTVAGSELLIRVGGYYGLGAGLAGNGTIELTLVPFETFACCLAIGGCALTSAYECPGVFYGDGSLCAPSPCPSFAGSCCTGSHCSVLDAAPCASAGGTFGGSGSVCVQALTCCRANFNSVGGLSVADIFAFLSAWFASDPRADFNGDTTIGVADIFAFLSAWFAGC